MTRDDAIIFLQKELRIEPLAEDAEMGRTRGWDSLKQVQLLLGLERESGVFIPPDLFGELTSVTSILGFLADEGVVTDG